jgi:beta-lactam-binding protein with PASTA domain
MEVAEGDATRTAPGNDVPTRQGSEITLYVSSGPQRVTVPDLRGKSAKAATDTLKRLGFLTVKTEDTDSTAALKGQVVRTTPAAGATTAVDSAVVVFVGTGPKEVSVPDLVGQTEADARTTLEQMGLEMAVVQGDSERPAGQVVSTSPGTGQTVQVGSIVQVTISRGNQFVVPDLKGKTVDQARDALTAAGWSGGTLTTTQRNVPLNSPNAGKVLSQNPSAGSRTNKDRAVSVVIGRSSLLGN